MNNLEYLLNIRDKDFNGKSNVEARKVLALEIIAEELCKLNEGNPLELWNNRKENR